MLMLSQSAKLWAFQGEIWPASADSRSNMPFATMGDYSQHFFYVCVSTIGNISLHNLELYFLLWNIKISPILTNLQSVKDQYIFFPKMHNLPYQFINFFKYQLESWTWGHYHYLIKYSVMGTKYTFEYLAVKGLNVYMYIWCFR